MVTSWKLSEHVSPVNQMKKLVLAVVKSHPLSMCRIFVGSVLPKAGREVELEHDVKIMNRGLAKAVQQLKRHHRLGNRITFVPIHRIFLEI